jgi:hypothetical protein
VAWLAVLALAATPAYAAPPSQPNPQPLWNAYPLAGTQTQTTQTTPVQSTRPNPKPVAKPRAKSGSGNGALHDAGIALTVVLALALAVWVVSWAGVGPWSDERRRHRLRTWQRRATARTVAAAVQASAPLRRRPEVDVARGLSRSRGSYRDVTAERVADPELEREPEAVTGPEAETSVEREPETVTELLDTLAPTSARLHDGAEKGDTADVPPHSDEQGVEALKAKATAPAATTAAEEARERADLKTKLASENKIITSEAAALKAKLGASPALAPLPGSELLSKEPEAPAPVPTAHVEAVPLRERMQTRMPPLRMPRQLTRRERDLDRDSWRRRLLSRRAALYTSWVALAIAAGIVAIIYANWVALALAVLLLTAFFVSRS